MVRIILGGLLGAIVLYGWGTFSWMVLPWHNATFHELSDDTAMTAVLQATTDRDAGVYALPSMPADWSDAAQMEAYKQKHAAGPLAFIVLHPGGPVMPPSTFVIGFAFNLVTALIAAILLWTARHALRAYWQRILFVMMLGVFVAAFVHVPYWNWMHVPDDFTIVMIAEAIVSCLLAGLVIGAIVKERSAAPLREPN